MAIRDSRLICPNCGKVMVQQFVGLKHCICGLSWKKGTGYFTRTSDMVFELERRGDRKQARQVPVIRYNRDSRPLRRSHGERV